ncbi:hypothetical protein ZHAS_00016083 [Anopheles sinensis]|uniref:Uncharacterized protein n=1 Tax=Anopheles sinensis TaxID=74873 RepID=A0A084WD14_ANOSI|nr:hypothetical protein ZHAS_00016083 [Anopheles sinensis]
MSFEASSGRINILQWARVRILPSSPMTCPTSAPVTYTPAAVIVIYPAVCRHHKPHTSRGPPACSGTDGPTSLPALTSGDSFGLGFSSKTKNNETQMLQATRDNLSRIVLLVEKATVIIKRPPGHTREGAASGVATGWKTTETFNGFLAPRCEPWFSNVAGTRGLGGLWERLLGCTKTWSN